MAPTLFKMYACVVLERWPEKVEGVEGIGTHILYKLDQQLFRRNTTGACQGRLTECQFADGITLLASTHKCIRRGLQDLPVHSNRLWSVSQ